MKLAVLGSTGSIGTQTLEVVSRLGPAVFSVVALSAGRNIERLIGQIRRFHPRLVCVAGQKEATALAKQISTASVEILHGEAGLLQCAAHSGATCMLNALVGARGLSPTLAALEAGVDVALANKESLVVGGALVEQARRQSGARLMPVDSEHSAIWQLLQNHDPHDVERLIITASGGALRQWPLETLYTATPKDALKHPNWNMGARVTVDAATLVNKAFEVIEAHWLFEVPYERIEAILHPQSLLHGMVEFRDGAVLAHLGMPDMKVPIQYALTAPAHQPLKTPRVDWAQLTLDFDLIDRKRYPAFATVLEAGRCGGTAPAAINAADEVLVQRFLQGEIPFTHIATGLQATLEAHAVEAASLETVRRADRWARQNAAVFH